MKRIGVFLLLIFITHYAYADYITQNITGGCDSQTLNTIGDTTYLEPVFTKNTYTCSSGTFLPANTLGCRSCPLGYTCSGGTFEFNETVAQGITVKDTISANASNACSSNVLNTLGNTAYLEPVFTPNTVSLTWDDGTGNTVSSSCTYDGLINLPPEPTPKPGYVFSGWKVQTNN